MNPTAGCLVCTTYTKITCLSSIARTRSTRRCFLGNTLIPRFSCIVSFLLLHGLTPGSLPYWLHRRPFSLTGYGTSLLFFSQFTLFPSFPSSKVPYKQLSTSAIQCSFIFLTLSPLAPSLATYWEDQLPQTLSYGPGLGHMTHCARYMLILNVHKRNHNPH
jgi:hypothetical protein